VSTKSMSIHSLQRYIFHSVDFIKEDGREFRLSCNVTRELRVSIPFEIMMWMRSVPSYALLSNI
jgi:hypothetical protein